MAPTVGFDLRAWAALKGPICRPSASLCGFGNYWAVGRDTRDTQRNHHIPPPPPHLPFLLGPPCARLSWMRLHAARHICPFPSLSKSSLCLPLLGSRPDRASTPSTPSGNMSSHGRHREKPCIHVSHPHLLTICGCPLSYVAGTGPHPSSPFFSFSMGLFLFSHLAGRAFSSTSSQFLINNIKLRGWSRILFSAPLASGPPSPDLSYHGSLPATDKIGPLDSR